VSNPQRQFAPARSNNNDRVWLDALLQKNATVSGVGHATQQGCRIRVASRTEQLHGAEQLVRKRYEWRGYQVPGVQDAYVADSVSRRVVLVAEKGCGALVGTVTVRPDSPPGLLAEMTYGSEIQALRQRGHRLGEVVKLAVDQSATSRFVAEALIRSAYLISHKAHERSHVVIEVNPRHVRFYEKVLGCLVIAAERLCARVGAPSVLMELDLEQFERRLQATSGKVRPALEVVT
jgi:ribosomal protein S18 acetylase RimI-like enzyme